MVRDTFEEMVREGARRMLAAALALDLVLFMHLAECEVLAGIQEWLSFYFKSPEPYHHPPGHAVVSITRDGFAQKLASTQKVGPFAH